MVLDGIAFGFGTVAFSVPQIVTDGSGSQIIIYMCASPTFSGPVFEIST